METKQKYGLYVHIPFCVSKCSYCDFASVAKNDTLIMNYTKALCKEMAMHKAAFSDAVFDTVFIGGGTPSCIPQEYLAQIIDSIYANFNTDIHEFTVEINPGTGSKNMFKMLAEKGVSRASVGLQCANDEILKTIGRIHTVADFEDTISQIKAVGITNFSADIISGLPKQTKEDIIQSIDLVHQLGANHVSMYTLKLEDGTPLKRAVESHQISIPTIEEEHEMSQTARKHLLSLGYNRYEISNFAKEGFESKHNLKYWERVPYLGVGVAAASMYNDTRYLNTYSIKNYISEINSGKLPLAETTKLSKEDISFEMIMLFSRLSKGMAFAEYNAFTNENFKTKYSDIIKKLIDKELIEKNSTHFVLTPKGMDLQNRVLLMFMD